MKLFHSRIISIIRDLTKHSVIQQNDFYWNKIQKYSIKKSEKKKRIKKKYTTTINKQKKIHINKQTFDENYNKLYDKL